MTVVFDAQNPQDFIESVSKLIANENFEEAIRMCDSALADFPESCHVLFQRAYLNLLSNRLNEVVKDLERLISIDPSYHNAMWMRAGSIRQLKGELHPETVEAYARAFKGDSENHYLKCEFGDILRANGRYAEARKLYEEIEGLVGMEDEALKWEAVFNLGVVCMSLGDFSAAQDAFKRISDTLPDYPNVREMLALLR